MTDQSDRLALPYILPAQAQKHVTHNEALQRLDILVQLAVEDFDAELPPAAPAAGEAHALGAVPQGDWAGHAGEIAAWTGGAWQFIAPQEGWRAVARGDGTLRIRHGGAWRLPEAERDNLDGIGIGTVSDGVNRLAVAAEASLFSHDGASHRMKINKAAPADTASLLFQTGWSGRAEFGLAGEDGFSVKVSADGTVWRTAFSADAATGNVGLGAAADPVRRLVVAGTARIEGNLAVTDGLLAGNGTLQAFSGGALGGQMAGSNFGTVLEGAANGHLVLAIRENNASDSVSIVSGGGDFAANGQYDTVVASFLADGSVGIGRNNPQRRLHLSGVMRLDPQNAPPAGPVAGDLYFDGPAKKLRCHDGTAWRDLF